VSVLSPPSKQEALTRQLCTASASAVFYHQDIRISAWEQSSALDVRNPSSDVREASRSPVL
jgi:hypothetical protein